VVAKGCSGWVELLEMEQSIKALGRPKILTLSKRLYVFYSNGLILQFMKN